MKQKGDSNKKDKMKGELCACKTVKNLTHQNLHVLKISVQVKNNFTYE